MIKIDKYIREALLDCFSAIDGGQLRVAEETGIQQASLSRWNSGKVECMTNDNWRKIVAYIGEYLPEDYIPKDIRGRQIKNLTQGSLNTPSGNPMIEPCIKILEKEPLLISLVEDFHKLDKKQKLKLLLYIEELE
ncbi:MAG: hypothetical protein KAS17_03205 [Victivallaceae bacterium]|nr:hypothetical protein [Victivallaceae bacterium]